MLERITELTVQIKCGCTRKTEMMQPNAMEADIVISRL